MTLMVYNTMTRAKEPFETIEPGVVRMYVCGVTVYSEAHIGHAMSAITFDMIRRHLEWSGYTVRHVVNFTDVDDKIITRAAQLGINPFDLAQQLIDEFMADIKALNVLPATAYPRASQEIPDIIKMIQDLIELGYAYPVEGGDVNYRVTRFAEYGKLSHRRLEDMQAGARIEVDPRKEHPMDFALWKAAKPGEPAWDSPWGPGRPGWHIECSVMATKHLGDRLDIHGGGADLIFPHHENEIAQSEAFAEHRPFARYWIHNGLLQLGGEKMSKSIGNLVPMHTIVENGDAMPFRLLVLQSIYRHPLVFNEEVLEGARRGVERLNNAMRGYAEPTAPPSAIIAAQLADAEQRFRAAMDDDFNTPIAVSILFDLARAANRAQGADRQAIQQRMSYLAGVLGLVLQDPGTREASLEAAPFIDLLVEVRAELRNQKLWALSDKVRDRLAELGVMIEDSPSGTTWRFRD